MTGAARAGAGQGQGQGKEQDKELRGRVLGESLLWRKVCVWCGGSQQYYAVAGPQLALAGPAGPCSH